MDVIRPQFDALFNKNLQENESFPWQVNYPQIYLYPVWQAKNKLYTFTPTNDTVQQGKKFNLQADINLLTALKNFVAYHYTNTTIFPSILSYKLGLFWTYEHQTGVISTQKPSLYVLFELILNSEFSVHPDVRLIDDTFFQEKNLNYPSLLVAFIKWKWRGCKITQRQFLSSIKLDQAPINMEDLIPSYQWEKYDSVKSKVAYTSYKELQDDYYSLKSEQSSANQINSPLNHYTVVGGIIAQTLVNSIPGVNGVFGSLVGSAVAVLPFYATWGSPPTTPPPLPAIPSPPPTVISPPLPLHVIPEPTPITGSISSIISNSVSSMVSASSSSVSSSSVSSTISSSSSSINSSSVSSTVSSSSSSVSSSSVSSTISSSSSSVSSVSSTVSSVGSNSVSSLISSIMNDSKSSNRFKRNDSDSEEYSDEEDARVSNLFKETKTGAGTESKELEEEVKDSEDMFILPIYSVYLPGIYQTNQKGKEGQSDIDSFTFGTNYLQKNLDVSARELSDTFIYQNVNKHELSFTASRILCRVIQDRFYLLTCKKTDNLTDKLKCWFHFKDLQLSYVSVTKVKLGQKLFLIVSLPTYENNQLFIRKEQYQPTPQTTWSLQDISLWELEKTLTRLLESRSNSFKTVCMNMWSSLFSIKANPTYKLLSNAEYHMNNLVLVQGFGRSALTSKTRTLKLKLDPGNLLAIGGVILSCCLAPTYAGSVIGGYMINQVAIKVVRDRVKREMIEKYKRESQLDTFLNREKYNQVSIFLKKDPYSSNTVMDAAIQLENVTRTLQYHLTSWVSIRLLNIYEYVSYVRIYPMISNTVRYGPMSQWLTLSEAIPAPSWSISVMSLAIHQLIQRDTSLTNLIKKCSPLIVECVLQLLYQFFDLVTFVPISFYTWNPLPAVLENSDFLKQCELFYRRPDLLRQIMDILSSLVTHTAGFFHTFLPTLIEVLQNMDWMSTGYLFIGVITWMMIRKLVIWILPSFNSMEWKTVSFAARQVRRLLLKMKRVVFDIDAVEQLGINEQFFNQTTRH